MLRRSAICVAVPSAQRQVCQGKPGFTAAGRENSGSGDGGQGSCSCRRPPPPWHDLQKRRLRVTAGQSFNRQCPGSVADSAQAAPRRRLPAERPVRISDGHVIIHSVRDDAIRHLLPGFPRHGRQHPAVGSSLLLAVPVLCQVLHDRSICSQYDQTGKR